MSKRSENNTLDTVSSNLLVSVISAVSDISLVERYRTSRDRSAINELYHRYRQSVMGLSMYYLHDIHSAEDVTMDVFEKVIKVLPEHEVQNFKNWILTITRHHCLKLLSRGIRKENELINKKIDPESVETPINTDQVDDQEVFDQLENALEELKADQRKCVSLFYLQGMSYLDIENITGYTNKQVKSYIQNGKLNLKKKLKSYI